MIGSKDGTRTEGAMSSMPTTMNGEIFLNKTEAAEFLGVSFPTFEKNFEPKLTRYRSPRRSNVILFKRSDLEAINKIEPIEEDESKGK